MAKYKKKCVYCGKDYESDSRNQRYCSEECCEKAQDKNYKIKKTRARKRREYSKSQEIQRALAQAYSLAHKTAEVFEIPKVCQCKLDGEVTEDNQCLGDLELNHKNCNPFDNSPWNLEYRCKKHHAKFHTLVPSVNVVQAYVDALEKAKDVHEIDRTEVLVDHLRNLVESVIEEVAEKE